MPAAKPESNVKTALRVIDIIEIFAREARPLALSELARQLDAPVQAVWHCYVRCPGVATFTRQQNARVITPPRDC